ncbi:MAG: hypothetical protein ACPGXI_10235, partial [Mycobacterium sp.]
GRCSRARCGSAVFDDFDIGPGAFQFTVAPWQLVPGWIQLRRRAWLDSTSSSCLAGPAPMMVTAMNVPVYSNGDWCGTDTG